MKTLRLLSFVLCLLLISCNSDDNATIDITNLNGSWNLRSFENDLTTTINVLGLPVTSETEAVAEDIQVQITFSENPNVVVSEGNYTLVVTTTVLTETDTQEFAASDDVLEGTWTLNGNEITITSDDADLDPELRTITYRIVELSETRMQLKADFRTTQTVEGTTANIRIRSEIVMTRS
ncbi:lipocalin family protein [Flavobacteriaceae bacterium M23B6Z8]